MAMAKSQQIHLSYKYILTNENGLHINQLITKPKLVDDENKIKILTIGKENSKPTKSIFLIGQTGSGKTTLLNGMINHMLNVKFEDPFRYCIRDEVGEESKISAQSQTEFVTAYLIYHQPGLAVDCNFLIIDTPGLGDTSGKEQQQKIKQQLEMFLYEEKYGVNELHCLGFVVNGTINRSHDYLKNIIGGFESLFGKDTVDMTKILATHTSSDNTPIAVVLNDLKLESSKLYTFDNGVLSTANQGDGLKVQMGKLQWMYLMQQYKIFFEDMLVATPGSLKLTKQATLEKMELERSLLTLKRLIDDRLKALLECNSTKRLCEEHNMSMKSNENFEREETYVAKIRTSISGRDSHAHNCPSCDQTCVYPCNRSESSGVYRCPQGEGTCDHCPCTKGSHKKEAETISSELKKRKVTNEMMKEKFEQARNEIESSEERTRKLEEKAKDDSQQIAILIKKMQNHIMKINEISRLPNPKTPKEHVSDIIKEIRDAMETEVENPSDKKYVNELLDDLPKQVDQVVLKEPKTGMKEKMKEAFKNWM